MRKNYLCARMRRVSLWALMFTAAGILSLNAASGQLSGRIAMGKTSASVEEVFDAITRQSGYDIFYNYDELDIHRTVTLPAAEMEVGALLRAVLGDRHGFQSSGNTIVISQAPRSQAQPARGHIAGRVTDAAGEPLRGVTVVLKGSKYGTVSDAAGRYELDFPVQQRAVVVFSMIGMRTEEVVWDGQRAVDMRMVESVHDVEQVVVTGYGDIPTNMSTASIFSRRMEELDVPGITTVDALLEGRVPGLFFTQTSGQPGATPRLRVRGTSTIVGNQSPLLVVDGIVQSDPVNLDPNTVNDPDFVNLLGNAIMGINPNDIERIDVLKDAAATALYGARAANGIIVLTTKKGQAGPPRVGYRFDASMSTRPRYTDRGFNMMNSAQRVDLSRELIEKGTGYGSAGYTDQWSWPGFEGAYLDYFKYGTISFDEYQRLTNYYESLNTDWLDILTRDTFSQNHSVNVGGGSQLARYYVSLGYADEQGNIRGESNRRYSTSARLNTSHGRFSAQVGMQASINDKDYVPAELNVMSYASTMSRAIGLRNEDGSLWYYPRSTSGAYMPYNIRNEMDNSRMAIDQNMVSLNANVQYNIADRVRAQVVGSYQFSATDQEEWYGENSFHSASLRADGGSNSLLPHGGVLKSDDTRNNSYMLRAQLDYSDHFDSAGKHFFNAMLVGEISSSRYLGVRQEHRGYFKDRGRTFPSFDDLNVGTYPAYLVWLAQNGSPVYAEDLTNLASLIATATYSYDERYVLNVNTRSDWSNAFGSRSNEKFMPIWSVSGRWNIDRDLLEQTPWVEMLALRASYGTQGNMHTNQPTRMTITKGEWNDRYGSFTSTVRNYPNPDLRWEKTNSYNVGLDFSLWAGKLSGQVQYYYKKTTDALLSKRVSTVNGVPQYMVNAGDVENQGIEVSLNFKPIDQGLTADGKRGWVWRIDPQIGQAVNQLLNRKLSENQKILQDEITLEQVLNGQAYIPGRPLSTFYSFRYAGLNNLGRPTFTGLEEDNQQALTLLYSEAAMNDRKEVWWMLLEESGHRDPVIQGGVNNYVAYRNFSLAFNLAYSVGNKVRLLKLHAMAGGGNIPNPHENMRAEFADRWRNPGDEARTDIPAVGIVNPTGWWHGAEWAPALGNGSTQPSLYQMYDDSNLRVASGNYLKLQSLTLRYTLGERLVSRIGMSHADVALVATNLFTLCDKKLKGQEPSQFGASNVMNITPRPTCSFSLNINF
jgi:TonB-linked SusC/RagA family outer membrane protein